MSQAILCHVNEFLTLFPQLMTHKCYLTNKGCVCWVKYPDKQVTNGFMNFQLRSHLDSLNSMLKASGFLNFQESIYQCFLFAKPMKRQNFIALFNQIPDTIIFFIKKDLRHLASTSIFFHGLRNEIFPDWISKMTSRSYILIQDSLCLNYLKKIHKQLDLYQVDLGSNKSQLKKDKVSGKNLRVKKEENELASVDSIGSIDSEESDEIKEKSARISDDYGILFEELEKMVENANEKCFKCKEMQKAIKKFIGNKSQFACRVSYVKDKMGKVLRLCKKVESSVKELSNFYS